MTNYFRQSYIVIKAFRRRYFMQIFTEIIFEERLQLNLMLDLIIKDRSMITFIFFQELRVKKID